MNVFRRLGPGLLGLFLAACSLPPPLVTECLSDADCMVKRLVCDPSANLCVACMKDADCIDTPGSVCTAAHACMAPSCAKNADCSGDTTCNLLKGACESSDFDGGSGANCTTKYDCPDGQACPSGRCMIPPSTCRQDTDCARGHICNFSQKCEPGCNPNEPRDCAGPKLCHPQKFGLYAGIRGWFPWSRAL